MPNSINETLERNIKDNLAFLIEKSSRLLEEIAKPEPDWSGIAMGALLLEDQATHAFNRAHRRSLSR